MIARMGKTSRAFDAMRQQFLSPDQNKIEDELRLTHRAEIAGKDNTPIADAAKKDSLALDIDTYLNAMIRNAKKELEDHLHGLSQFGAYQTTETHANEIWSKTKTTLNSLREACRNGVNDLFSLRKKVADGERELETFRKMHGLERPAVYPQNRHRIFAIVFFLFTLEVALNAYTLGSAHPDGPLGVVLETFMIAALNITIGFTSGRIFWREICHRSVHRRLFGLAATITVLIVTLAGNLAVGHYRDALLSTSARAQELGAVGFITEISMLGQAVTESLTNHAFALQDFKSYLTIFVGVALALYAAKEAFGADDSYPGYGRRSRNQDERGADYANMFARLQSILITTHDEACRKLGDMARLADGVQAAKEEHNATAERLISDYCTWVEEIRSLGSALYAKYREINERYRTEVRPPCFDIDFSFPEVVLKAPHYGTPSPGQAVIDINVVVSECSERINISLNKFLGVYKTIGALVPDDLTAERVSSFDVEVETIYHEIDEGLDHA